MQTVCLNHPARRQLVGSVKMVFGSKTRSIYLRGQVGLSMVELLVATILGLIIVAALTQLFADVSRTNREMAKTNSQIENARFAMQFLRNDILHAGFWGSFVPQFDDLMLSDVPSDTPSADPAASPAGQPFSPCVPYASWALPYRNSLLGLPVMVYGTPPADCTGVVVDKVANTDILVIRHAETCVAGVGNCDAEVPGRLYFQASNCQDEIDLDTNYSLDTVNLTLTERDCGALAGKRRFIQHIYYIRSWANAVGDGIPTLVRSEFDLSGISLSQQPALALVQGIERFRVEVGLDQRNSLGDLIALPLQAYADAVDWEDPADRRVALNRGNGVPESFIHCPAIGCSAEQLVNVVAVKIYLLARADEPSPGYEDTKSYTLGGLTLPAFNDGFKRHVFSSTIRVNNVAGRRETP
jgi:type IV pilus assembly protein PilW